MDQKTAIRLLCVSLAVDVGIVLIFGRLFDLEGWVEHLFAYVFLLLLSASMGLRKIIKASIHYRLSRREAVWEMVGSLKNHEMPNTGEADAIYYYQSVIDDRDATEDQKIAASNILGYIGAAKSFGGTLVYSRLVEMHERALLRAFVDTAIGDPSTLRHR